MALTSKHWRLFDLLTKASEQGTPQLTQKDICDALPDHFTYDSRENVHDHCNALWEIVNDINHSLEVDKIIVVDKLTYRFGTKEECQEYADKLLTHGLKKLKRAWAVKYKIKMDGQGKLLSNQDNPIDDESKAKLSFEAFIQKHINEITDAYEQCESNEPKKQHQQYDIWGNPIL